MALKGLTIEEMEPVSAAWVDETNPAHQAILTVAELSGLLPKLKGVHAELHAAVPQDDPLAKEISQLSATTDATHDALARGVYGYLTEVALLVDDGTPLLALRDELMPEGLSAVVHNTYRGQAGFAALLRGRLTSQSRGQLRELPLPGGKSLHDAVEGWLAAADRLGELEETKARLQASVPTVAGRIFDARNRWIRTVNALIANAALAELDEEQERLIFGPLRAAEATADARAARRGPAQVVDAAKPPPQLSGE